jgi:hypothetical protein
VGRYILQAPPNHEAFALRATVLAVCGPKNLSAAAADLQQAMRLQPVPEHAIRLIRLQRQRGDLKAARQASEEALERIGPTVPLLDEAVDVELALGRIDQAQLRLQQIDAQLGYRDELRRARFWTAAGRSTEARQAYEQLLADTDAVAGGSAGAGTARRRGGAASARGARFGGPHAAATDATAHPCPAGARLFGAATRSSRRAAVPADVRPRVHDRGVEAADLSRAGRPSAGQAHDLQPSAPVGAGRRAPECRDGTVQLAAETGAGGPPRTRRPGVGWRALRRNNHRHHRAACAVTGGRARRAAIDSLDPSPSAPLY